MFLWSHASSTPPCTLLQRNGLDLYSECSLFESQLDTSCPCGKCRDDCFLPHPCQFTEALTAAGRAVSQAGGVVLQGWRSRVAFSTRSLDLSVDISSGAYPASDRIVCGRQSAAGAQGRTHRQLLSLRGVAPLLVRHPPSHSVLQPLP
jgi:hypothetical protein